LVWQRENYKQLAVLFGTGDSQPPQSFLRYSTQSRRFLAVQPSQARRTDTEGVPDHSRLSYTALHLSSTLNERAFGAVRDKRPKQIGHLHVLTELPLEALCTSCRSRRPAWLRAELPFNGAILSEKTFPQG
jgi:hypothetical protein